MQTAPIVENPLTALAATPANHFRFLFYEAALVLLDRVAEDFDSLEDCAERFPFVAVYCSELAALGLGGVSFEDALERWRAWSMEWENQTGRGELPAMLAGAAAGLDRESLLLLFLAGIVEEDARFGQLFETWQSGQRPTFGLLQALRPGASVRERLRRLIEIGALQVLNPQAPRMEWILQTPNALWDVLRGERPTHPAGFAKFLPLDELPSLRDLELPEAAIDIARRLPTLLRERKPWTLLVRGFENNGRRTLLGAMARECGRGMLLLADTAQANPLGGLLAVALHAVPVLVVTVNPGDTVTLANWPFEVGVTGIVAGRCGAVTGSLIEGAIPIALPMPGEDARLRLWRRSAPAGEDDLRRAAQLRLTSGNLCRAARASLRTAAASGRNSPRFSDIRGGASQLGGATLELLATRLEPARGWSEISLSPETFEQLLRLESRCRRREAVAELFSGARMNCGVRALFSGPSGAGKTLAARVLAALLERDLYRLDLSQMVSKYIGETEKNLERALSRAEALDIALLLDEGDALLTQRTQVQNSTDRYANLETNYLLQRLESFEGIVFITTNAPDNIDSAFLRRMDHVVRFRAPEASERLAIWRIHLPLPNLVTSQLLHDIALRCALSGGQIRNAATDCGLTAIEKGSPVTDSILIESVAREYRKNGALCPMQV